MSGVLRLNGATSGYIEIKAPAEANGATHTIPNTGFAAGKIIFNSLRLSSIDIIFFLAKHQ